MWVLLLLLLLLVACGGDRMSPEQATELVTPHLDRFETFDAWARRAVTAQPAFRTDAALEETVFAPLRREDDVLAAFIARDESIALAYGRTDAPPTQGQWTGLRTERLGSIEVTVAKLEPPTGPVSEHTKRRAVVIRRTVVEGDGARVTVTLALAIDRSTE